MKHRKWMLVFAILAFAGISPTSPLLGEAGNSLHIETQMVQGSATWEAAPVAPLPTALIPPASIEGGDLEPTYSGCGGGTSPAINAAYEQEVVERVNTIRAANNLPPLKRSTPLDDAARYHATDMGQDNYFDHDTYDRSGGSLVYVCEWYARITSYYSNWRSLAENIAAGYATPESVMNAWMNSSGHRSHILSSTVSEIGVGYFAGSGNYSRYWVQDFGRRNGVYPLVINREAAMTDVRDVSLYIYGDWQEMRLRNEDGPWTVWQPFQSTVNWTLYWRRGERTVWAEMRSGSQTAASSDTIYLTTGSPVLGDLPDTLWFTYSMVDERLSPGAHKVTPQNVGSDDILTWAVSADGDWFAVDPLDGATPDSFWITPTTFDTHKVATYTGTTTVTIVEPSETENSPQQIDLILTVMDEPFRTIHLPLIGNRSIPAN